MKIGIITIHSAYNYGAVFQAFALKEYLHLAFEEAVVNVIDYRPDFFESKKKIHFTTDMISNLIELEKVMMYPKLKRRADAFESFIENNDALSLTCKTKADVDKLVEEYDVIISGSDQVWNFTITGGDRTYLLDFADFKGKLMSYASSLGSFRFYEKDVESVKAVFARYSNMSCREKDGCEYLAELTGKDCTNVCDPTLLLDGDNYLGICNDSNVSSKIKKLAEDDYILIYNLSSSADIFEAAKKLAESKNLKVYQIFPSIRKNSVVDKLINNASPEEFLYLFSKAKFTLTNSFHGTCFSVIFRKQFFTIKPTGSNNRLESMLNSLGIGERLVTDTGAFNPDDYNDVDFDAVSENLKIFRSNSVSFLDSALKN